MVWIILLIVLVAGGIGGVVNSLLTDNGFIRPKTEKVGESTVWRAGVLGNIILGALGAVASWGLYGPAATAVLMSQGTASVPGTPVSLTLSTLMGGVLVGVAGARWWTNETDKKALQMAASKAAGKDAMPRDAERIMSSTPFGALKIVSEMP